MLLFVAGFVSLTAYLLRAAASASISRRRGRRPCSRSPSDCSVRARGASAVPHAHNSRSSKIPWADARSSRTPSMTVNYGERVALVGPNGAGKSTLFSIILKKDEPDAGAVERDEWTMVGYLPQEGEALGDETVLDVATGRAENCRRWKSACTNWRRRATSSGPEYLEAHAKHDALNDPQVEAKAKKMLRGLGYRETDFRPPGAGDERRLDHARASGAVARDGARSAPARRADESPRPALAALAAELSEELFRRAAADFARSPVHG